MIVARNGFDMIIVLYCLKLFIINVKLINYFLFLKEWKREKQKKIPPPLPICSCVFLSLA